ncbi:Uncharacterized protein HZ326_28615 [Fusarium oxysporum f. sp. albedinis]|nr:Uncharacterized protein HZ326_28615 [Fusarium oxysporum f. sp. albedinis]
MVGTGLRGRNAAHFAFSVYRPKWKCGAFPEGKLGEITYMISECQTSVFETHGVEGLASSPTGVGVRSCTSSFETTLYGSRGTNPALLKAALIFLSVMVA